MDNYYKILGIVPTATDVEIKKAYRELTKKYHPDASDFGSDFSEAEMKRINEAFNTLSDKDARARYDAYLRSEAGQSSPRTTQNNETQQNNSTAQNSYSQQQRSSDCSSGNADNATAQRTSTNTGFKIFTVLLLITAAVTFWLDCTKPVNYRPLAQQYAKQAKQKHANNKKKRATRRKRRSSRSKTAKTNRQKNGNNGNNVSAPQQQTNEAVQPQSQPTETTSPSAEEAARLRREENLRRIQEAQ